MKRLLKLLAALPLLLIGLYLTLVIVNWQDAEPSAAVLRFEGLLAERPEVADAENGYLFLLGMESGPGADPLAKGIEQRDWLLAAYGPKGDRSLPAPPDYEPEDPLDEGLETLFRQCIEGAEGCRAGLSDSRARIEQAIADQAWRLDRYRELLGHGAWQAPALVSIHAPLPSFQTAFDGQRLLFMKAWMAATEGKTGTASALVAEDVRFWRMLLRESEMLITKVVAAAALERHFTLGSLVLQRLPEDAASDALPAAWREAIPLDERSLELPLEYAFVKGLTAELLRESLLGAYQPEDPSWSDRLLDLLIRPLFKPQDTINRQIEFMIEAHRAIGRRYHEIPAALNPILARDDLENIEPAPKMGFYNPVGDLLLATANTTFGDYAARVADLEGIRRAALARVEMHAAGIGPGQAEAFLGSRAPANPYTEAPFRWLAEQRTILFEGLAEGERGRHLFP